MKTGSASTQIAGDLALLNRISWSVRWQDHAKSVDYAKAIIEKAGTHKQELQNDHLGRACLTIAWQYKWHGRFTESLSAALDVEKHLPEADFPVERAHNYAVLGFLHFCNGRMDLAGHSVDRGLSVLEKRTGLDRRSPAYIDLLMSRANIYRYQGDTGRAGLVLGHAEEVATDEDSPMVQHYTARWLLDDKCPDKAAERSERALEEATALRASVLLPFVHEVLGEARSGLREFDEAETSFKDGLADAEKAGNLRAQAQILRSYSRMELKRGNSDLALKLNRRGAEVAARMNYLILQLRFARECAALLESRNEHDAALQEHNRAWGYADKCRS